MSDRNFARFCAVLAMLCALLALYLWLAIPHGLVWASAFSGAVTNALVAGAAWLYVRRLP